MEVGLFSSEKQTFLGGCQRTDEESNSGLHNSTGAAFLYDLS